MGEGGWSGSSPLSIALFCGGIGVVVAGGLFLAARFGGATDEPAIENGTYYRVVDSAAGTYETAGSNRPNGRDCTWVRSTTAPFTIASTIAMGDVAPGQHGLVTLKPGEYFISYGCDPWRPVS